MSSEIVSLEPAPVEPAPTPDEKPAPASDSAKRRLTAPLQAAALLSALYFLSKLTGLVQQRVILQTLPTEATDAYTAAFRLTDFVNYLVAGGALSITFIPLFTELREKGNEDDGWKFFSTVFSLMGIVVSVLVLLCVAAAAPLMRLFAPGLDGPQHSAGTFETAVRMSQIILPGQIFFVLGGIIVGALNAQKRFGATGFTGALYNIAAIFGAVVLWHLTQNPEAFAWGILFGAFVGYLVLPLGAVLSGPVELRPRWFFSFPPRHPLLKKYFLTALPIMLGVSFPVVDQIVVGYFASKGAGWLTYLSTGNRLMIVAQSVMAQAAAVAAFPYLASDSAAQNWQKLADFVRQGLRRLTFITLPLSVWMMLTARPTVDLLYGYGKFKGVQPLHDTAIAYAFYSAGLFAWAAQQLIARGFYALKDTRTPTIIGSVITVFFFIPLVKFCSMQENPVLLLALATSVGACVHFSAMMIAFERKLVGTYGAQLHTEKVCGTLLRTATACLLMGIAGLLGLLLPDLMPLHGKMLSVAQFCLSSLLAWPVFGLAAHGFRIPEWAWLWNRLSGKITQRLRR